MSSSNFTFSCGGADRVCLETANVTSGVPIPIFWPKGQFPQTLNTSDLKLKMYKGDLIENPQDNPCSIGSSTPLLQSWDGLTETDSPYSNMESALITISSENPGSNGISQGSENVFFQLTDPASAVCLIGPYSILKSFTSLTVSRNPLIGLNGTPPLNASTNSALTTTPTVSVTISSLIPSTSFSLLSSTLATSTGTPTETSTKAENSGNPPSLSPLVSILVGVFIGLFVLALALFFFVYFRKRNQKSDPGGMSVIGIAATGTKGRRGDSVRALNADGDSIVTESDGRSSMSPDTRPIDPPSHVTISQKEAEDISKAFRNELFNKDNL